MVHPLAQLSKIATATGKTDRKVYRETRAKRKSTFSAMLGKEFGRFTGSANYMLNCGLGTLLLPISGVLLLLRGGVIAGTLESVFETDGAMPVLLTAAADRYFPKESLALGDAVRLLGDAGEEVFLGAVQAVSRNVETVTLIACDRGLYLTANEMSGVFAGSPEGICRAVAMRLSLPVGTLEVPAGWKRLVAGAGVRAFDILRQAVGEDREISIQNGALTVTKAGQERFAIAEETVLASRGTADARQMVNRCAVIDRRGAAAATAQNTTDLTRFGLRQRVLGKSGDAAAQAQGGLRGRILRGELTVRGDLRYRCGATVELHRKEFGLDGAYPLTAVRHRWERGLFTTELT